MTASRGILSTNFRTVLTLYTVCIIAQAMSAGALEVNPGRIDFKSIEDSASLAVSADGVPLDPADVKSVKLLVGLHDYDHMIHVGEDAGKLVIRPTKQLEMGTYDLVVSAPQGTATIPVVALFESVDSSFEAQAARQGVTVSALKEQLGLTQTLGLERIRFNLPPLYYPGQALEMQLPVTDGRTAKWLVNSEEFTPKEGRFRFVFEKSGVYDIGYLEHVDGRTLAFTTGTIRVVPEPAIPVLVDVGTALTLHGPPGFEKFAWYLDENPVGAGAEWAREFEAPGMHTVAVRASQPASETRQPFRELTYLVTVVARSE